MSKKLNGIFAILAAAALAFSLAGCATQSKTPTNTNNSSSTNNSSNTNTSSNANKDSTPDDGTTDKMWNEDKANAELIVFKLGNDVLETEYGYAIDLYEEDIEDGGFYKITADVTYLNGGIAGYVNYPQIKSIKKIEKIDPMTLDLKNTEEIWYGLTKIGDWADADLFFYDGGHKAVWKDGKWIYDYASGYKRDDGSYVCTKAGISKELVEAKIGEGTVLCEEYFLLPASGGK